MKGFKGKSLFMIEDMSKDESYDTLALSNNGKGDIFVIISSLSEKNKSKCSFMLNIF